jgi:hypothetical protein
MGHKGFSHVGLSTLDLDKTREFYEGVLGSKPMIADTIKIKEGCRIRHRLRQAPEYKFRESGETN